jgi:hypothetical protein
LNGRTITSCNDVDPHKFIKSLLRLRVNRRLDRVQCVVLCLEWRNGVGNQLAAEIVVVE